MRATLPGRGLPAPRSAGAAGGPGEPDEPEEVEAGVGFDELPDESDDVLVESLFDSLLVSPDEPFDEPLASPEDESEPPVDGVVELDLPGCRSCRSRRP